MATVINVKLGERSYPIHIGRGLAPLAFLEIRTGTRVMLVADATVDAIHGDGFVKQLQERGLEVLRVVVPAEEHTKSLKWVDVLYARAAEEGLDRSDVIVALGGGMTGDLAGFVAATYLRGVRYIQIPTSLLAMVDSSVGGKTGINLAQGKNLVGAFHQPIWVEADLDRLKTLPEREYVSGLAEVVKYGVIWDAPFFARLEKHADDLLARDLALLEQVVARCCEIKAEVVALDERETGPRAILNFGHTLGHALEKVDGYGRWLHGEAVAIGMHFAVRLSTRVQGLAVSEADRITGLLEKLGLPVRPARGSNAGWPALAAAMMADKKTVARRPRFVLAKKIGAVVFDCEVDDAVLVEAWNVCCK